MILCIETSTAVCSVALCDREKAVAIKEEAGGRSHAAVLSLYVEELLKEAGVAAQQLEAVAVSRGPGSYTGLRIGVSVAKGIAYGASIPLISVDTTLSMLHGYKEKFIHVQNLQESDLFCPVIDARRMEVYSSILGFYGDVVRETSAEIINQHSFPEAHECPRAFVFGDGAQKCIGVMTRPNIIIDAKYRISASSMRAPAYQKLNRRQFEDVAYFEPFYLKDFLATKPVKNILI